MNDAKPFQEATIRVALDAFDGRRRVRRFLVADEVGLGKTIVARGVIKGLIERKKKRKEGPLRVFYVCSSLAIASQNGRSLLKVLDDIDERKMAACNVDRLTLASNGELPPGLPLHLYTLTPDTSIPDRRGKHRSGAAPERALIHNLLLAKYPNLVNLEEQGEWLQRHATSNWDAYKAHAQPTAALREAFDLKLREHLSLDPGNKLAPVLRKIVINDPLDAIKLLRVVLAKTGLANLAPDLIIFDEFQRFTDLLSGYDTESEIARLMVQSGPAGPAVLLLSATPYEPFVGDFEHAFSNAPHHKQFYDLVEWLLGKDVEAFSKRRDLEGSFSRYGVALRARDLTGSAIHDAKTSIELCLRHVIARTERFSHDAGHDVTELVRVAAPLIAEDLQIFEHLTDCFRGAGGDAVNSTVATAIPYWSSVPLPMQMLGPDYQAWRNSKRLRAPSAAHAITKKQRDKFLAPSAWPHPRLRGLMFDELSVKQLSVPWIAPSMPWWESGGSWIEHLPHKILLFSRFKAVPRAIASLLSFEVERHLLSESGIGWEQVTNRSVLGPSRKNFAFFHTSGALAQAVDPWRLRHKPRSRLFAEAEKSVKAWLWTRAVPVKKTAGAVRSLPELLVRLERKVGTWDSSLNAWRTLATNVARTNNKDGELSLRARIDQWHAAVDGDLSSVSPAELAILAQAALASPGVIIARSLARHGLDLGTDAGLLQALQVAWEGLRSYLNNPWMDAALGGSGDLRERIAKATIDGNLESVLDEHLWVTRTLRNLEPFELPGNLGKALGLRTSDVALWDLSRSHSFSKTAG